MKGPRLKTLAGPASAESFPLLGELTTIGRGPDNNVVLASATVSRHHAHVRQTEAGHHIEDLGSANGVQVNGQRVHDAELRSGDRIRIGEFVFTYQHELPGRIGTTQAAVHQSREESNLSVGVVEEEAPEESALQETGSNGPAQFGPGETALPSTTTRPRRVFSGFVERILAYDWKTKIVLLVLLFTIIVYQTIIVGVFEFADNFIITRGAQKAELLVSLLAEKHRYDLYQGRDLLIDLESILNEPGVVEAYLADELGRIRVPTSKQGQALHDTITKTSLFQGTLATNYRNINDVVALAEQGQPLILAYPVKVWIEEEVTYKVIGVAKLLYAPTDILPPPDQIFRLRLETFLYLSLGSIFLYFGIFVFTIYPLRRLKDETELLIKENISRLTLSTSSFQELTGIVEGINRIMAKKFAVNRDASGLDASSAQSASTVAEPRLEFLLQTINEGVLELDPAGIVLRVGGRAALLLSLSFNGGVGLHLDEVVPDKDLREDFHKILASLDREGTFQGPVRAGGPGQIVLARALRFKTDLGQTSSSLFCFTQQPARD